MHWTLPAKVANATLYLLDNSFANMFARTTLQSIKNSYPQVENRGCVSVLRHHLIILVLVLFLLDS